MPRGLPQGADPASAYLRLDIARLERVQHDRIKLLALADVGEPEAQQRAVFVTVTCRLAFNVRTGHELLQAGAG